WGGVATTTAMIKVALSMEMIGESVVLEKTVNVMPRSWWIEEQHAGRVQYEDPIPGWATAWGLHRLAFFNVNTISGTPFGGSGPWEGSYMVVGRPPKISGPEIFAHKDLMSLGKGYLVADTTCDLAADLIGSEVNLASMNGVCGTASRLVDFHQRVLAHELRHETSLNECIRSVRRAFTGRLQQVEQATGTYEGVEDKKRELWTGPGGAAEDLENARWTNQETEVSDDFWQWRPVGVWWDGPAVGGGHNGRNGC
ncbi:MAG: hypothetical protein J4F34_00760, partial [Gemmatimonadetes bacterium]|nr:hypothetical protein [Gemmatimonadota bacterium]